MSKSNIVLNNVMLINNGRAADFLKWIHDFYNCVEEYFQNKLNEYIK